MEVVGTAVKAEAGHDVATRTTMGRRTLEGISAETEAKLGKESCCRVLGRIVVKQATPSSPEPPEVANFGVTSKVHRPKKKKM